MCLLHTPAGPAPASQPVPQPAASCPQARGRPTNFREILDERLSLLRPSLPTLRLSTRNANPVAGLSGLRRSAARRPPALHRQRPTPSRGGSPGEILAGRKQAVEAAGGSEGVHRSSSPVGMLRSAVGVGVGCASHPAATSPVSHHTELSQHGALTHRHLSLVSSLKRQTARANVTRNDCR